MALPAAITSASTPPAEIYCRPMQQKRIAQAPADAPLLLRHPLPQRQPTTNQSCYIHSLPSPSSPADARS
jgi:hypothetical protein